jgi:hypothetical protein
MSSVTAVTASGAAAGHPPQQAVDGNAGTAGAGAGEALIALDLQQQAGGFGEGVLPVLPRL